MLFHFLFFRLPVPSLSFHSCLSIKPYLPHQSKRESPFARLLAYPALVSQCPPGKERSFRTFHFVYFGDYSLSFSRSSHPSNFPSNISLVPYFLPPSLASSLPIDPYIDLLPPFLAFYLPSFFLPLLNNLTYSHLPHTLLSPSSHILQPSSPLPLT